MTRAVGRRYAPTADRGFLDFRRSLNIGNPTIVFLKGAETQHIVPIGRTSARYHSSENSRRLFRILREGTFTSLQSPTRR
jgi:hypothetical protein